jgi:hypothetical protein
MGLGEFADRRPYPIEGVVASQGVGLSGGHTDEGVLYIFMYFQMGKMETNMGQFAPEIMRNIATFYLTKPFFRDKFRSRISHFGGLPCSVVGGSGFGW